MQTLPMVAPPRARADMVSRVRLLERLDRILDAGVGLVSAAAGYGKTTLLASWVAALGPTVDVTWLTLEREHEDHAVLAGHLAVACEPVASLTTGAGLSDALLSLARESQRRQRRIVLVLDDTHTVSAPDVWDAFASLLERRPSRLIVVMSGREDPRLPWGTLRAHGQLVEIRSHDLAFDRTDTRTLFTQTFNLGLPDDRAEDLRGQTEGWVTGLCLAGLAMEGTDDAVGVLDARPEHLRHITEYFEQEVLRRLTDDDVTFLEHTAVLDRVEPALCDHLTGRSDSVEILRRLVARNVFTEQVLVDPPTFRYHDLLSERLRRRLQERDPDKARALLEQASRWYEQRGQSNAAIELALRSGDVDRAGTLIRAASGPAIRYGYAENIVRWLRALPDEFVWYSPDLLLVLGRSSGLGGDLATAETALLAASKAIMALEEPIPVALRIGLLQLEASVRAWGGALATAIEPLEQALTLYVADPDDRALGMVGIDLETLQVHLALEHLLAGRFDQAIELVDGVLEPATIATPTQSTVLALGVRALALAWKEDDVAARQAVRQGTRVLQAFSGPGSDPIILHVTRAWLGDDPDADHGLAAASAIAHRIDYAYMTALVSLASARLHLVRGAPFRAGRALAAADDVIAGMPEPLNLPTIADWLRAQLPISQPDGADHALNEREIEVLAVIARGATRRQAARQLHLSINTVKTHLRTAYHKLGASDRDEAVAAARAQGLLDDPK